MNKITALGKSTAKMAAAKKQAGILAHAGGFADDLVRGAGKLVGRGFNKPGILPKALTGAGVAATAAAGNEGLAYAGLPHFHLDKDPMWSPNLQGVRRQGAPSVMGQLGEFFKRPVQSVFGNSDPNLSRTDAMTGNPNVDHAITGWKTGPNGEQIMQLKGEATAPLAPSYLEYLKRIQQMNKTLGSGNGQPNEKVKYIFGAPSLPSSSTF